MHDIRRLSIIPHTARGGINAGRYEVVRSRAAPDSIDLVYDELGVLGDCASA